MRWLQLRFEFDSTAIRLLIKTSLMSQRTYPASRSHTDLFIYLGRSLAAENK